MFGIFAGNSIWQLIRQSDTVSLIVLSILFFISVVCWAVFLCKAIVIRIKRKNLCKVLDQFHQVKSAEDILALATHYQGTLPGYFLSKNLVFLKSLLESSSNAQFAWEQMQNYMDQLLDTIIAHEESYLPVLSTSAAVAPLLGLFGTVWGLIHAFIRINATQAADIVAVAPGIAEALITTLAGLIVAIPALIMYNYLAVQVKKIEQQLIQLTDRTGFVVQQLLRQ